MCDGQQKKFILTQYWWLDTRNCIYQQNSSAFSCCLAPKISPYHPPLFTRRRSRLWDASTSRSRPKENYLDPPNMQRLMDKLKCTPGDIRDVIHTRSTLVLGPSWIFGIPITPNTQWLNTYHTYIPNDLTPNTRRLYSTSGHRWVRDVVLYELRRVCYRRQTVCCRGWWFIGGDGWAAR